MRVLVLDNPDGALPALIGALLPVGVKGLVVAGLLAALMSSLSSRRARRRSRRRPRTARRRDATRRADGLVAAWIAFS